MKKNRLFCGMAAALMLGMASCNSAGKGDDKAETSADSTEVVSETQPEAAAFDKAGVYTGVIPCADCSGIETTLELRADGTYRLTEVYLEKKDGRFESSGKFEWDAANACISLGEGEELTSYIVEGDHLVMLDKDGHRITGELADHYVLTKKVE